MQTLTKVGFFKLVYREPPSSINLEPAENCSFCLKLISFMMISTANIPVLQELDVTGFF